MVGTAGIGGPHYCWPHEKKFINKDARARLLKTCGPVPGVQPVASLLRAPTGWTAVDHAHQRAVLSLFPAENNLVATTKVSFLALLAQNVGPVLHCIIRSLFLFFLYTQCTDLEPDDVLGWSFILGRPLLSHFEIFESANLLSFELIFRMMMSPRRGQQRLQPPLHKGHVLAPMYRPIWFSRRHIFASSRLLGGRHFSLGRLGSEMWRVVFAFLLSQQATSSGVAVGVSHLYVPHTQLMSMKNNTTQHHNEEFESRQRPRRHRPWIMESASPAFAFLVM